MAKAQASLMLPKLADAVATAAGLQRNAPPGQCVVFTGKADEARVPRLEGTDKLQPHVTFRITTPTPSGDATARVAIQGLIDAPDDKAALTFAERVHNAFLYPDDDAHGPGLMRRGWAIDGYVLDIFDLLPPGLIGVDEHNRSLASINLQAGYYAVGEV